jgi:putative oxidoreductase
LLNAPGASLQAPGSRLWSGEVAKNNIGAGMTLVRCSTAGVMLIHGLYRMSVGGIPIFGAYLSSRGLPFGTAVSAALTLGEVIFGALLIAGRYVVPLSAYFVAELAMGIFMVHAKEGWFVVGGGRNGAEYSVLLILNFLAVILSTSRRG